MRLEAPLGSIATWDASCSAQPRVLVPIDVQALYVPAGSAETFVRLPFRLTTPDGSDPEPMPAPFDAATRPHRRASPLGDAAIRFSAVRSASAAAALENDWRLRPLPDRWVVLAVVGAPRAASGADASGWVIEADTSQGRRRWPWPRARGGPPQGKTIPTDELTGTVGGTFNWMRLRRGQRTAARSTIRSPISETGAAGVIGDFATYLVCGWWSDAALDPLDVARTSGLDALNVAPHRRPRGPRRQHQEERREAEEAGTGRR